MNKEHRLTICEVAENLKSEIGVPCSIFKIFLYSYIIDKH